MKDDALLKAFGSLVLKKRIELGISQEKLAEASGLDRTYVSSVECGKRNVSLRNIVKLSNALCISPCYLLDNLGDYIE